MNRFDILFERPVPAEKFQVLPSDKVLTVAQITDHLEKTKFDENVSAADYLYRYTEPVRFISCTFKSLPKFEERTRFEILRDVD